MNELAKFGFAIKLYQQLNGNIEPEIQIFNEKMPKEVIIMQLKKYLSKLENNYLSA